VTDHTTIQITTEQAAELAARRTYDDEPYKSVIARLLDDEDANNSAIDESELAALIVDQIGAEAGGPRVDDSDLAREVARQMDYVAIADSVAEQVARELQG